MFSNFKNEWNKLSQLGRIMLCCNFAFPILAFLMVTAETHWGFSHGTHYGLLLMGMAAVIQCCRSFGSRKIFAVFIGLCGLVFLVLGIFGLIGGL